MVRRPPAPQAGASASSATSARRTSRRNPKYSKANRVQSVMASLVQLNRLQANFMIAQHAFVLLHVKLERHNLGDRLSQEPDLVLEAFGDQLHIAARFRS